MLLQWFRYPGFRKTGTAEPRDKTSRIPFFGGTTQKKGWLSAHD